MLLISLTDADVVCNGETGHIAQKCVLGSEKEGLDSGYIVGSCKCPELKKTINAVWKWG